MFVNEQNSCRTVSVVEITLGGCNPVVEVVVLLVE
jgi:hypothetical protein